MKIRALLLALTAACLCSPLMAADDYGGSAQAMLRGDYVLSRYYAYRYGYSYRAQMRGLRNPPRSMAYVPTAFYQTKEGKTIAYAYRPVFFQRRRDLEYFEDSGRYGADAPLTALGYRLSTPGTTNTSPAYRRAVLPVTAVRK